MGEIVTPDLEATLLSLNRDTIVKKKSKLINFDTFGVLLNRRVKLESFVPMSYLSSRYIITITVAMKVEFGK